MSRAPDERYEKAKAMFLQGKKLIEIAKDLGVPEGTVRRWKSTHKWGSESERTQNERTQNKANVRNKKNNISTEQKEAIAEQVSQVIDNPDLTDKQRFFCLIYVDRFNATKAYQKSYGCDYYTAKAQGYKLLQNIAVRKEIDKLIEAKLNRAMIKPENVFQKYMDIAFADITDYVEFGVKNVDVIGAFGVIEIKDPDTGEKTTLKKEVNSVRFRESNEVDGTLISEVKQGKDGASIKLPDRMKALEWLANHMDMATDEQKARIEHIKAQTNKINAESSPAAEEKVVIINDVK